MKTLSLWFNRYVNSSVHVAFAVCSLVGVTCLEFGISSTISLLGFVFFATITGYNFVKYAGVAKLHHRSLTNNLKMIQIFSLFCFIAMCYFAFQLPLEILIFSTPFVGLTFLYAVPFWSGFHKNLRQISYLKVMVVAFVWSGFTVLIPYIASGKEMLSPVLLLGLQRFLIVMVLILPFDIRDVKYDAISLQTIPTKIGVEKTKRVGLGLMVFVLLMEYAINANAVFKNTFMIFFFIVLVFLMRSKIEQSKYYSSFWVESLPLIWWLLILGFHNL